MAEAPAPAKKTRKPRVRKRPKENPALGKKKARRPAPSAAAPPPSDAPLSTAYEYPKLPAAVEAGIPKRLIYDFESAALGPHAISTWRITDGALIECDEEFLQWCEKPLAALETLKWMDLFPGPHGALHARLESGQLVERMAVLGIEMLNALSSGSADYVIMCTPIVSGTGRLKFCYAQIFALHDANGKPVETCVITTEVPEDQARAEIARGAIRFPGYNPTRPPPQLAPPPKQ